MHLVAVVFLALCFGLAARAETAATPATAVAVPDRERFHLYLLLGQSNMAGRGTPIPDRQTEDPRLLSLNPEGRWVLARDPLHPKIGRTEPGIGPGLAFAREMLKADPAISIGLVPCAVGGSPLRRWTKGADLYEQALARARLAASAGVLKGVLWHQGETDSASQASADTYETRLTQMIRDLRQDLGRPELPIVVGQLGDFLTPEKQPFADTVRSALKRLPTTLSRVGYADSAGLGHKGDQLHFSAAAQEEMGIRFARAMRALQEDSVPAAASQTTTSSEPAPAPLRIARFSGDRAAALSYTFDDGLRDQFTLAVPMLNEAGFKGTFFVIPGQVAETVEAAERKSTEKRAWGGITWDELRSMAGQGHEIGSHTWSHRSLPKLTAEEVETELTLAAATIEDRIGRPALTLAFPFNQSTPEIEAAARKHHAAFRDRQTGVGGEKSTVVWLNQWADQQIRDRAWGVIMAHAIGHGYAAFTDPEILRTHFRYVKSREADLWVDTFARVALYGQERDNATLTLTVREPGRLVCILAGTLDPAIYDVPLTLVLDTTGASSAHAERAGRELPVRVGPGSIQLDAIPAREPITITWR